MKYGLYYFKNTHNIGDDMWAYAQSLFYPRIDYLIDNTTVYNFKSTDNEEVATIIGAFVEPYNCEYAFAPPSNIIPLFAGAYFRPTMREFLQLDWMKTYLKANEPIGARTSAQAEMFQSWGIAAYFSGCITLTLPNLQKKKQPYICLVDVPDYIVDYVRSIADGKFDIRIMSHEVSSLDTQNATRYNYLPMDERFDIVRGLIETYAGAHCVITSRLHAALPALTQNTPVLLAVPDDEAIGMNDIHSRLRDFFPLLHHHYYTDFLHGKIKYDIVNPPNNSDLYTVYSHRLAVRCRDFIGLCEEGNIVNRYPYTGDQAHSALNVILQNKVHQLKAIVDNKKFIVHNQHTEILNLQRRLRKYETFNEWKNVEYFGDWENRSLVMCEHIGDSCASLLDLGCGEMHIRKHLPPGIQYYGCDYTKRDAGTIVCDLAAGEFPNISVDTVFIAGLLEYLNNWESVLEKCALCCRQMLVSYSTLEVAETRDPIWVTAIARQELVEFIASLGFRLCGCEEIHRCEIFNFIKVD